MKQVIVKGLGRAATHRTEWLWGGLGLGTAGLSACFAAYMMAMGPSGGFASVADFGVFARMRPSARLADSRVLPVLQGAGPPAVRSDETAVLASAAPAVDLMPTGTVSASPAGAGARSAGIMPGGAAAGRVLPAFFLREVFGGQALVESPSTLTLVSKGSVIAGAGTVLSIERRGTQWAVVTSEGIIAAR